MSAAVLLFERPQWYDRANCAGLGPDMFYVERGADQSHALAVCAGCQVRVECLTLALERGEDHGLWGGCAVRQRRRLRRAVAS